jgi:hypothetical protein
LKGRTNANSPVHIATKLDRYPSHLVVGRRHMEIEDLAGLFLHCRENMKFNVLRDS